MRYNILQCMCIVALRFQELTRQTIIEGDNGRKMEALKVFSESISYLKKHFFETCQKQDLKIVDSDITWVITVPAIWNDSAKQFMREAGNKVHVNLYINM